MARTGILEKGKAITAKEINLSFSFLNLSLQDKQDNVQSCQ